MRNFRSSVVAALAIVTLASSAFAADKPAEPSKPPETAKTAKPSVYLEVRADREDALYKVGQTITFRVQAFTCTTIGNQARKAEDAKPMPGVKLTYRITGDGGLEQAGELVSGAEPVTVETRLDRPGFVLCAVGETALPRWWQYKGRGGAGVEPLKIEAGVTKPDDFDAFWAESLAELKKVPMDGAVLTEVKDKSQADQVTIYKVKVPAIGAGKEDLNPFVTGYLCKPVGAKPGSLPAMLNLPGAGVRSPRPPASTAIRHKMLALSIGVHGLDVGQPKEFYRGPGRDMINPLYKITADTKAEALRVNYHRTVFLGAAVALEFLKSQPEWDRKTLIISGGSQGGGLSLIGAGLDPQVTACKASYPGYCDQYGYLKGRPNGWPKMIKFDKQGKITTPLAVEMAAYFDAVNFARRLTIDCVLTTGFIDTTCPPSSVYAAYNQIPSKTKRFVNGIPNGHEGPRWDQDKYVADHLAKQKGK